MAQKPSPHAKSSFRNDYNDLGSSRPVPTTANMAFRTSATLPSIGPNLSSQAPRHTSLKIRGHTLGSQLKLPGASTGFGQPFANYCLREDDSRLNERPKTQALGH